MTQPAFKPAGAMRLRRILILLLILLSLPLTPFSSSASPGSRETELAAQFDIPAWMSSETANALDLGFEVLVPSAVPDPFAGEPSVTSYDGYYSLYWMITGAPPTFLQISGELGGEIPDYSKYDRNNQLEQNAEVAGTPAYHDLTPIYDLVYWQIGDTVYSVESRNLTSEDSLSLANSLISLSPTGSIDEDSSDDSGAVLRLPDSVNAGEEIAVEISGADNATLSADDGYFPESGEGVVYGASGNSVVWKAPNSLEDTSVFFVLSDPETGDWLATANTLVVAGVVAQQDATLSIDCPSTVTGGEAMTFTLSGSGAAIIDAGDGYFPAESPNTDFAPDADGGSTMVGVGPGSGSVDLVWIAPDVDDDRLVYLFASNENGETPGECEVQVVPGGASAVQDENASSADPEVGASQEENNGQAAEATEEPQPTATEKPPKPTKTPVPYDEIRGLPTTEGGSAEAPDSGAAGTATITPSVTATVRQSATFAPTTSDEGMVASIIGPDGGTLTCPVGAALEIPAGALKEPSTVTINPIADSKLPVQDGVEFVPGTAFDVTIAGADGRAIDYVLPAPARLSIELDAGAASAGVKIYRVDGASLVPLSNTRIAGDTLTVSVDGFSRFVAGVSVPASAGSNRNLLPFVLAAVVALFAMIAMVVLGGIFRPRRHRVITNRRTQRPRYR